MRKVKGEERRWRRGEDDASIVVKGVIDFASCSSTYYVTRDITLLAFLGLCATLNA